jgi:hypothetical protein
MLPGWLPWALFVHDQVVYREQVPGEQLDFVSLTPLAAEYVSRALAGVGLVTQACTLATADHWRTEGWARYLAWQGHAAAVPPESTRIVGKGSLVLPPGERFVLLRGQPARGVWPELSCRTKVGSDQFTLESELWSLVDLGTSESCTLGLMNDLRSHFEDRNFVVGGRVSGEESCCSVSSDGAATFLNNIWRRMSMWGDHAPAGLDFARADSLCAIVPEQWRDVPRGANGWLVPGRGWISWSDTPRGVYQLVMRGEPAHGIWPIAEVVKNGIIERELVDSWDWAEYSVEVQVESTNILIRLANDYWDPSCGEDRNLWCWGLIPQLDDCEGRNQ